jgi:hypothetical protein
MAEKYIRARTSQEFLSNNNSYLTDKIF